MQVVSAIREPLVTGGKTVKDVSHDISRQVEGKPTRLWWMAFGVSLARLALGWRGWCMWGWCCGASISISPHPIRVSGSSGWSPGLELSS
uniref:Uncharacterized protein n=1 Tax=Anaerolinea thermolimosa TaxID=229919 RepID=A0A7C4KFC1_9CHLR